MQTDFLIIGSGIAGLSFALKTANRFPLKKIVIITKADEGESNTRYAQGGVAIALNKQSDSFSKHIQDTLIAGDGCCNRKVVQFVVHEGPERLNELIEWGAQFDKEKSGNYDLGKEGGHTVNRIVHHKDCTGLEMELTLLKQINKKSNIKILAHHFAVDLLTERHVTNKEILKASTCYGAYALNLKSNKVEKIISKITLLATGGIGQVYKNTTNPKIATGDGIAMAFRANAIVKDMAFIQFHPTALYDPNESPTFLISEAVRGFGAYLKTQDGTRFMKQYDKREELASRDIVARAIDSELINRKEKFVYLDCRHLNKEKFLEHFPTIYKKCKSIGIDVFSEMIPVVPAAHYLCGGVMVDSDGRTSIENLYASGECAYTGLHGANRLASNSLLEALVFSHHCYLDVIKIIDYIKFETKIIDWVSKSFKPIKEKKEIVVARTELKEMMSDYLGIVRSNHRLQQAKIKLHKLMREIDHLYHSGPVSVQLCELNNLVSIANLIISQSLKRKKNRGVFFNTDLEPV